MQVSQRNLEDQHNNLRSSNTFYKQALRGDRLGQKAMNEIRLKNYGGMHRSDSNDSLHSNEDNRFTKFSKGNRFAGFNNTSQGDKENQGFRANKVNPRIFESPDIVHKGNFNNMNRGVFHERVTATEPKLTLRFGQNQQKESKIAKLRNQHDEYTRSNNLGLNIPKLQNQADSKIPRLARSQDPSTSFSGSQFGNLMPRAEHVVPNHYSKGFRDHTGNVSNLCSRFGRPEERVQKHQTDYRHRSADNVTHSAPFLRTFQRGLAKKQELDERISQERQEKEKLRHFKASEFTAREAEVSCV